MTSPIRIAAPRRPGAGKTVAEVMTPNPTSIRADAALEEAVAFLVDSGYSAAPVIDEAGRPVGVISRTDVVVYDRERLALPKAAPTWSSSIPERPPRWRSSLPGPPPPEAPTRARTCAVPSRMSIVAATSPCRTALRPASPAVEP